MKKKKTIWVGKVEVIKSCPENITVMKKGTVITNIERGENMITIYDNRKETKEKGEIALGIALVEIKKGIYNDSFKAISIYLRNTDRKKARLEMFLEGATIKIKRDGQDVLDDIIA